LSHPITDSPLRGCATMVVLADCWQYPLDQKVELSRAEPRTCRRSVPKAWCRPLPAPPSTRRDAAGAAVRGVRVGSVTWHSRRRHRLPEDARPEHLANRLQRLAERAARGDLVAARGATTRRSATMWRRVEEVRRRLATAGAHLRRAYPGYIPWCSVTGGPGRDPHEQVGRQYRRTARAR
jgi:hypothetical protein